MSYISKLNQTDDNYFKKNLFRKPLKNRISDHFKDDLVLCPINPFSQQLTPWNGSSKLQASINLLKKQTQSKKIIKHASLQLAEPSVQKIVEHDNIDYSQLAFHSSNQKFRQSISRYACPRLKINSQEVMVSKNPKDQVKRFLFHKKPLSENKNIKKIANLTIEWDQDIVYNPQKKYFEQQNLKRKILREFSDTKNENRKQNLKRQLKRQDKSFKFQLKNNKIHRKDVSIFEFKKKDYSLQLERNQQKSIKAQQMSLKQNDIKQSNDKLQQVKVNTLNFEPYDSNKNLTHLDNDEIPYKINPYRSDKWKFRTSLKSRRTISPQKALLKKNIKIDQNQKIKLLKQGANQNSDKQILNKITLELNKEIKNQLYTPLQVFAKTSPHFFKKIPT